MSSALETRDRILEVARKNFAFNGYFGTSMDSIVQGTGLSKGAIYWHFKGKKELFRAVLEKEAEALLANLVPREEDLASGALEFFILWGERYLDMVSNDRELKLIWLSLLIEAQRGQEDSCDLSNMAAEILDSIHQKIRPMLAEIFPELEEGKASLPLADLVIIVDFFFDSLVLNLGVRADLEKAKIYWRFVIDRLIEGGKSYVS